MGFLDDVANRLKSEAAYKASSGVSSAAVKGASKLFQKGDKTGKCPKCGAQVTPGVKFCPKCGTKLTVTCKKCNVDYPIGTKFCTQCGGKL